MNKNQIVLKTVLFLDKIHISHLFHRVLIFKTLFIVLNMFIIYDKWRNKMNITDINILKPKYKKMEKAY